MLVEEVLVRWWAVFWWDFREKKITCTKSHAIFFALWLLQFSAYPLANV